MKSKRATTREGRRPKNPANLPNRFQPRFLEDADNRFAVIKTARRQLQRLIEDAGIDSYQKELLAKEAVFIGMTLETMRTNALEGRKPIDTGVYTQMVNCYQGLLMKLGLDKSARKVGTLAEYVGNGK